MSAPVLRLAAPDEAKRVVDFVNANFDWRLPLINREEYFNFYYKNSNSLQFALAEEKGLSLEEAVVLSTATGAANVMCSGTQAAEYSVIASLMPKVIWHQL